MFFTILVVIFSFPAALMASEICMQSNELEAALIDWYEERPAQEYPPSIVLWKSENGATWTLVKYDSNGTACTIEHGSNWAGSRYSVNLRDGIGQ